MNELFKKEGRSIFTFKKGDIVIRLKPIEKFQDVYNDNLGITVKVPAGTDSSYREPNEFIGIENNLIYLRELKPTTGFDKKWVSKLNIEQWSEDWELFVVPDGLTLEDCI